jgi:hypothetical protein
MDGFEKVRPSWKKIKNEKTEKIRRDCPIAKVTFSSTLNKDGTSLDRIGFNKTSCNLLVVTKTVKCELFIHKKDKKLCIEILSDPNTEDAFTLSYSKENSCIRKKNLFTLLCIPQETIKLLQKKPFVSELKIDDLQFVVDLPYKIEKEVTQPYSIIVDSDAIHSNSKNKTTDMPMDIDLVKELEDL